MSMSLLIVMLKSRAQPTQTLSPSCKVLRICWRMHSFKVSALCQWKTAKTATVDRLYIYCNFSILLFRRLRLPWSRLLGTVLLAVHTRWGPSWLCFHHQATGIQYDMNFELSWPWMSVSLICRCFRVFRWREVPPLAKKDKSCFVWFFQKILTGYKVVSAQLTRWESQCSVNCPGHRVGAPITWLHIHLCYTWIIFLSMLHRRLCKRIRAACEGCNSVRVMWLVFILWILPILKFFSENLRLFPQNFWSKSEFWLFSLSSKIKVWSKDVQMHSRYAQIISQFCWFAGCSVRLWKGEGWWPWNTQESNKRKVKTSQKRLNKPR